MPLIIVPTPIGNLEDVTLRALRALREADVIACEDTRTSAVFLRRYGISRPLLSMHNFNEHQRCEQVLAMLAEGRNVAVISDAGTPGVSDPGYVAIRAAIEAGYEVNALPGPCAFLPALLMSGLVPHPFLFYGFPPEKQGQRMELFTSLAAQTCTLVFYLSPHKGAAQVGELLAQMGDRRASLVREISKVFQEAIRGTLAAIKARLDEGVRGELVLVVAGRSEVVVSAEKWQERAAAMADAGRPVKAIAAEIQELFGVQKNAVKDFLIHRG